MKAANGVHLKTYFMLALMILFAPLGNVLLGKGMKSVNGFSTWQRGQVLGVVWQIAGSPFIWLGVASLLTFFVAYMVVLSWADYSYVQPASSFSYAVVAVLGYVLLGEVVTPLRAAGIAIICLGVFVVGRTPPRTTEQA
jgi:drug/metabolite transporter (DMT)-like permease